MDEAPALDSVAPLEPPVEKHAIGCAGVRWVLLFGPDIIIARKSKRIVSTLQEIRLKY